MKDLRLHGPIGAAYAAYDRDPRTNGPHDFESFADAAASLIHLDAPECPEKERNPSVPCRTPIPPEPGLTGALRDAEGYGRQSEVYWSVRVHHPDPCDACGMKLIWPIAGNTSRLCVACFEREAAARRSP